MKAYSLAPILVGAVSLLFSSTPGYATWWVDYDVTDAVKYEEKGGEGEYGANADYATYCYADAYAQIEGSEQNAYGGCYAYLYETDTIMDYDPEVDPPLVAHVSCETYSLVMAFYDPDVSQYDATAATQGYAGGYQADTYAQISEPTDYDADPDGFDKDIDVSYNGYPLYLREFAYATAWTESTETMVKAWAHAQCDVDREIEENP